MLGHVCERRLYYEGRIGIGGPVLSRTAALAVLVGILGCGPREPVGPVGARSITVQGLEQTVRLFPAEPAQGDELQIASVVVNRKRVAAAVVSRICGLDTTGDLELTGSRFMCAGYSMNAALAPGDSVTGNDSRTIASGPGRYTLWVRHLLVPDAWVDIQVVVH